MIWQNTSEIYIDTSKWSEYQDWDFETGGDNEDEYEYN